MDIPQAEDWQAEKCEVSLLEGLTVAYILSKLGDAITWLSNDTKGKILILYLLLR